LADVFPGEGNIYAAYRALPPRELAIVGCVVLDTALTELLSMRLAGPKSELESFLGINGDGRSPAGSFGARIQLAIITGILDPDDAVALRIMKNIRNAFAHRVNVNFLSPEIMKLSLKLNDIFQMRKKAWQNFASSVSTDEASIFAEKIRQHPEAGEGLFLTVFCVYQAYFHLLSAEIKPIASAL
jgi:hypothetical protein